MLKRPLATIAPLTMAFVCLALMVVIIWGRSTSDSQLYTAVNSAPEWSNNQILLQRAWAGAMPAIAADLAVLNIFNIYANSQLYPPSSREPWWSHLHNQLRTGQDMDPYFRDIYRLTEGLLAFEAGKMEEAVALLAKSEAFLNSSDPLLVASFIAHQELHNDKLAIELATKATQKPDAQPLAIGYATSLLKNESGCQIAFQFLAGRFHAMPEKYQQGIKRRIRELLLSEECKGKIQDSYL